MQHYLLDQTGAGALTTAFPHSPMDLPASIQDYLEDKLANGFSLVSMSMTDGGNWYFAFSVSGK